jgi:hypothetical protein
MRILLATLAFAVVVGAQDKSVAGCPELRNGVLICAWGNREWNRYELWRF